MKSLIRTVSKMFMVAVAIALLNAGPANGDVFQGCQTCGAFGCKDVADRSFGKEGCESYWGMNNGNFGLVCIPGSSICYKDSTSITVYGNYGPENKFNCDIWDWLMFAC